MGTFHVFCSSKVLTRQMGISLPMCFDIQMSNVGMQSGMWLWHEQHKTIV